MSCSRTQCSDTGEAQTCNPSVSTTEPLRSHVKCWLNDKAQIYNGYIKDKQGFFQQFWEKTPVQNCEKLIDLTSKLGEINYNSKIYPQNQVILDCIMPSILLKHMCLSINLIWVIVSHK